MELQDVAEAGRLSPLPLTCGPEIVHLVGPNGAGKVPCWRAWPG